MNAVELCAESARATEKNTNAAARSICSAVAVRTAKGWRFLQWKLYRERYSGQPEKGIQQTLDTPHEAMRCSDHV